MAGPAEPHGAAAGAPAGVEAAAAHGGGEHAATFPPFDATLFPHQLIWFAVAFVALYLVVSRVVLPTVGGVLAKRAGAIQGDIDAAATASAKADAAKAAAEKSAADARAKARETVDAMRAKAQAEFAAEQAKVDEAIAARAKEAEARIAASRAEALAEVPAIANALAKDIAARVSIGVVGAA